MPWRRKWQPTPVFLPGESHGQRTLAGCSPWGHKELVMTEQLTLSLLSSVQGGNWLFQGFEIRICKYKEVSTSPGYREFILAETYRSRDTRDADRVAVTPQEPNSVENQQIFEQWIPEFLLGMKEETDRTGSIWKAGLYLGPDCGFWALCPVSMEMTCQLENQAPWMEEPQGSYVDSPSPKRIP